MHWTKRNKLKDLYHEALLEYRKLKVNSYPVTITYIFTFKSRPLDTTNCSFMVKLLEDSLIANGVILNDDITKVDETCILVQTGDKDQVEICIAE